MIGERMEKRTRNVGGVNSGYANAEVESADEVAGSAVESVGSNVGHIGAVAAADVAAGAGDSCPCLE